MWKSQTTHSLKMRKMKYGFAYFSRKQYNDIY